MTLDTSLDPSITDDLMVAALTPESTIDYDEIFAAITARLAQDDVDELGAGTTGPATPKQAIGNAHALATNRTWVDVGKCLATVRGPEYLLAPMWPDAETAWEQADGKHRETDPLKIPRGAPVYWVNGRYGHIALSVGGGLCWTTDYHDAGYVGLASIAKLGPWCGGQLVGWAEELNGVDVWPDPAKPKKKVDLSLDRRVVVVRHALRDAKSAKKTHRAETLEAWLERLEAKAAKK